MSEMRKFMKIYLFAVVWILLFPVAGCERELNLGFRISETDDSEEATESTSDSSTSSDSESADDSETSTRTDRSNSD